MGKGMEEEKGEEEKTMRKGEENNGKKQGLYVFGAALLLWAAFILPLGVRGGEKGDFFCPFLLSNWNHMIYPMLHAWDLRVHFYHSKCFGP